MQDLEPAAFQFVVNKPYLPPVEEYMRYLREIWDRSHITNGGPLVKGLELRLQEFHGVSYPIRCVSNGTLGLQLIFKAMGIKGDVVTTPFTYIATSSSARWDGLRLKFADIESSSLTIDPEAVEASIDSRTEAILATHVYGNACDVEAIERIAARHSIPVIYDAAHAFGVNYKGRSLLEWGDASMVSTHATKVFHTVEGGFVLARDPKVDERIEWMRRFGHNGPNAFHGVGINAKMSELHAAMGVCMFEHINELISTRREIWSVYAACLANSDLPLNRLEWRVGTEPNWAYFPILFGSEEVLVACVQYLTERGVNARRYFYPSLDQLSFLAGSTFDCPIASSVAERVLCLPLSAGMAISDAELVWRYVEHFFKELHS
ncbi:DegT/DnrJ/EryC1/StrS family aminotransferase [Pelagicoccus mobilis]|uniref:DegT/DnrJ/EryC1/StrS family aminotransferase n=1 Tax=Pelagicoccus mobilis TaxID=415221 RepID=A0A934RS81_9BACT|nr:DegT/DnrJ/EryC1/StrS family aminotransferase [Pelagicoccus mobilis]MBK1876640.1 DegT/DnrJ/EryC1/StrS family aminotransferase [Pelagicoccus mobilis]